MRRTLWRGAWEHRAGCVTRLWCSTSADVTWCAVAGDTTHTSTPASGSATASSCGAAMLNATPAVRGQRCTHANENIYWMVCVCVCDVCLWTRGFMSLCFHGQIGTDKLYSYVMRNYCTAHTVIWRWGVMILLHTKLFTHLLGLLPLLGWLNTLREKLHPGMWDWVTTVVSLWSKMSRL